MLRISVTQLTFNFFKTGILRLQHLHKITNRMTSNGIHTSIFYEAINQRQAINF